MTEQKNITFVSSHRIARSALWVFLLRLANRAMALLQNIVLARLLSPYDFGLMGIAFVTLAAVEGFTQLGLRYSLIHKKGDTIEYHDALWTVRLLRGLALTGALFLIAPQVARFFNEPQAKSIIQVLAFAIIINCLISPATVELYKKFTFQKMFLYEISGMFVGLIVSVWVAIIYRSVWALVAGTLSTYLVTMVTSYIICPHKPKISFDRKKIREMFTYGKWITGSHIAEYLTKSIDKIFIGRALGLNSLGLYALADRMTVGTIVEFFIKRLTVVVGFPTYSLMQDDKNRLKLIFAKILKLICFITFPLAMLLFTLSPSFVKGVLGEKWFGMLPVIKVFAVYIVVLSVGYANRAFFYGIGKPKVDMFLNLFNIFLICTFIVPLGKLLGITGVALSILASGLFVSSIGIIIVLKVLHSKICYIAKAVLYPAINVAICCFLFYFFNAFVQLKNAINALLLYASFLSIAYIIIVFVLERWFNYKIIPLIRLFFKKK